MQLGPKGAGGSNLNRGNSSYGRSSEQDLPMKSEEIPVIEENYTPPSDDDSKVSFDEGTKDEIDVRDIPF